MNRTISSFRRLCLLALLLLFVAGVGLRAEQPRFPSSEDLRHVMAIAAPVLSPDGAMVLFSVTDATADGAKSHLWLVPVAGGVARQITYSPAADKRGERAATWAPDGGAIFFLAKRGEKTQLFRLPLAGGEAMPYELKVVPVVDNSKEADALPPREGEKNSDGKVDAKPAETKQKEAAKPEALAIDVSGYAVSPDGRWLAVWATDPETPGEKKAKEAKADAVWVNHERHGERLYLAALKADGALDGTAKDGMLKPFGLASDVQGASWSPKSDRLVAVTEPPNDGSDLGPASKAWVVSVTAPEAPIALKNVPATVRSGFGWKEDGSEIVFAAQTPEDAPPGFEELFRLALPVGGSDEKSAMPERLMGGFDGSLSGGEMMYLQDRRVVVPAAVGTRLSVVRIATDGHGTSTAEVLPQKSSIVSGLNTNRKQTGWVWLAESSDRPTTICYATALGGDCKVLATPDLSSQRFRAVPSKVVEWKNEGLTIQGLLYLPPEAATKKVPLIVDIHGGPMGAWEDRYQEWTGFLMGHGWAILRPNPRGSSAYGAKFAAANKNDLGGADFRDVMTGIDSVLKSYPIDPDKLALIGYSYGGEMAGFAEGKTDRFKAIVSGAPVIDQFSEYGTERDSWYDRWYFGKPWEHVEDAWRQSPLAGVNKTGGGQFKTPFLLLQGDADGTDPLGQSQEMYRALRQAGVPVEMVTYPREDHGPLARGIFGYPVPEPWHGFDGRRHIVSFLQKGFGEQVTGK